MFNSARLLVVALAFASGALGSVMPRAADKAPSAGAAYFIIDDPAQKLVALNIAADGTVGPSARVFNAGGTGVRAVHVTPPGKPPVLFSPGPDPLFTQGSVRVNEKARILVTVNPGSNTVSLFGINAQDPTKLTPIGKPVNSGGEFPNSVVINSKGTVTCVLNGGKVNGVNCFDIHPIIGLTPKPNTRRLMNVNQTTPPSGPLGSLSSVVFSPDESILFAVTKGFDATTNGYVAAWKVAHDGSLSKDFVKSLPDTAGRVPFTLFNIPGSNAYLAADPTVGFLTFDFGNSSSLSATATSFEIPNQILNCWVAYSSKSGNFYVIDPALSIINEVHYDSKLKPTLVKQYQQLTNSDTLDSEVAIVNNHAYLYVLQPNATAVTVLSVDRPASASHVQTFNLTPALKAAGLASWDKLNFQGMATFLKN
ncbi:hypothetical protein CVT26_003060 [Gymnopilus dilepis]|uniref:3-carboxymuconate cyclase n=1 Tax=Gymnopilus dilepis TaxID=231916 RepID=A0A409Y4V1_9AGAR|nr:hypothetical protein CVT26_003060 [Gymnopilus dilepis]